MPLYLYEHDSEPGPDCESRFELLQRIAEESLTKCPTCAGSCHRVITPFSTIKSTRDTLSTSNLERNGFTQYKKAGNGCYEKTCGKGPRVISKK